MSTQLDVIILGAGVVGLSAARRLARRGARVTVLDPSIPGGQASRAAAGVAVPSVRLLDDPAMVEFGRSARTAFREDLASLPEGPQLQRGEGILRIAQDAQMRDALAQKAAQAPDWLGGWVDAARVAELEPALQGTPILGAFLSQEERMVDTEAYLNALLADAARAGVALRLGESARMVAEDAQGVSVQTERELLRAQRLAVCAGAWSGGVAGLPPLPVRPVRGQMMTLFHPSLRLGRIISGPTYLAPWRNGEVVVGATEEEAGFSCHTTPLGLLHLSATVAKLAPRLREACFVRAWAGLRSAGPNGRPLIGLYPGTRHAVVATAHSGQGILSGALTGQMLVELVEGGACAAAAAFSPAQSLASAAA